MQSEQVKPDIKKIMEKFWDDFSENYNQFANSHASQILSLLSMLNLEQADNILEVGVGSAPQITYLLQRKKPSANLYLTDLSSQFLAITKKKLELLEQNKFTEINSFNCKELPPFTEPSEVKSFNAHLQQADVENLSDFKDNTIDCYISSLLLHLVPNPDKMISEIFRVLKPGGQAVLSIKGSSSSGNLFQIVPKIFKKNELNLTIPKPPSPLDIETKEQLVNLFKDQQFTGIQCWEQCIPIGLFSNEQGPDNFLKFDLFTKVISSLEKEKQEDLLNQIKEEIKNITQKEQEPIMLPTFQILVTKPLEK